jgi:hypothetical protein
LSCRWDPTILTEKKLLPRGCEILARRIPPCPRQKKYPHSIHYFTLAYAVTPPKYTFYNYAVSIITILHTF